MRFAFLCALRSALCTLIYVPLAPRFNNLHSEICKPQSEVGKIFKPSLRWHSIRMVYEAELQALGDLVKKIEIEVNEDKIHGSMAEITIKAAQGLPADDIRRKVEDILARYTVKHNLKIL